MFDSDPSPSATGQGCDNALLESSLESSLESQIVSSASGKRSDVAAIGPSPVTDPGSLPDAEVLAACRSSSGPRLLADLAESLPVSHVWTLLDVLPAPPMRLPSILARLASGGRCDVDPSSRVRILHRLEMRLAALEGDLDDDLVRSLGLPESLGTVIDMIVLLCEEHHVVVPGASAAVPLLHALDMLGLPDVFALLPAGRGSRPELGVYLPVEVLAASAQGSALLGAYATAVRLLVLLMVCAPVGDIHVAQVTLLRRLTISGRAAVPPSAVIDVWKLTVS